MHLNFCIPVSERNTNAEDFTIIFLDYATAFDKLRQEVLFELIGKIDLLGKYVRIFKNIYWDKLSAYGEKMNSVATQTLIGK